MFTWQASSEMPPAARMVIDVVAKRANIYTPKAAAGLGAAWDLTASRSLATDFAAATKMP